MTARNPWIDPRVAQVTPRAAEAYLTASGWKRLADANPNFQDFEHPRQGADGRTVRVPLREQGRDYAQRISELIADVALAEKRDAGAILSEILAGAATNGAPAGAVVPGADSRQP